MIDMKHLSLTKTRYLSPAWLLENYFCQSQFFVQYSTIFIIHSPHGAQFQFVSACKNHLGNRKLILFSACFGKHLQQKALFSSFQMKLYPFHVVMWQSISRPICKILQGLVVSFSWVILLLFYRNSNDFFTIIILR